jgi:LuxR family maltose regulon positive regulatory protein
MGCVLMGEPTILAALERNVVDLGPLLATKLHVPRTRGGLVERPRLVDRLTEGFHGELTVVCAPAGFGKTALLADWARRSGRAVAWLSLDEGDNDPVRFWCHVAAALEGARAGTGRRLGMLLRPPPRSFEAVVAALVNELAAAPEHVVLVLDDYHLIESLAVHQSLRLLLEHLPPGLRLAVASRIDPPLPLARLRARRQLAEVRAAELRFTLEETAALLREAARHDLSDCAVAVLMDRTEGWAAGLRLAALALRGREDIAAFVASFSGDHRYVLDYLAEEVLERQPEPVRSFLLETSVLDRLCGPLCDAVTGGADGQRLLETIERANLFLVPLDEVRGWWRYHQLFADLLRVRVGQERPERLPGLHRAAAAWLEGHGLVDAAIRHALAAGDTVGAAHLVERNIEPMLGRGETARWQAVSLAGRHDGAMLAGDAGAAVTGRLDALPAELVASRPRLCAVRAIQAAIAGQAGALAYWLDTAEQALADASTDEPADAGPSPADWAAGSPLADMPATVAVLRADLARLRGDAHGTIHLMRQVLSRLPAGERVLRFNADWNLARAHWVNGDLDQAEQALAGLIATAQAAGEYYLILAVCWELGRVQRARGRLGAALATYRQALAVGAETGSPSLPAVGIAQLGVAAVLYERGELAAALEQAAEGVARCRQLAGARLLAEGLVVLAGVRQALGDQAGAVAAVAEAERIGPSPDVVDLFNPAPAARARLMLARGQLAEAAAWAAVRGLDASDPPSYSREREHLLLARLLLAQGEPEPAYRLLERLHAAAAARQRTGSLIELAVLQARALAACGDQAAALAALAGALTLAWPERYVRVFAGEGAPLAALLDQLIAGRLRGAEVAPGVPGEYLARLRAACQPGDSRAAKPSPSPAPPAAGLAEPLTGRELEVLGLLAAGMANKQIARQLVVALETAKKHVSHILGKLGAANRTQAVARARAFGLLQ